MNLESKLVAWHSPYLAYSDVNISCIGTEALCQVTLMITGWACS